MTSEDHEDYRRAEEKFFDEGNPNTGDPPWLVDSQAMRGPRAEHDSNENARRHSIRYVLRWLQVSANLAQIAAALTAILGLYLTLIH